MYDECYERELCSSNVALDWGVKLTRGLASLQTKTRAGARAAWLRPVAPPGPGQCLSKGSGYATDTKLGDYWIKSNLRSDK